jgi:DNA (cytosine-5)-methyltransferase 1
VAAILPDVAETLMSGSSSPKSHGKKNGTDRETLIPVAYQCHGTIRSSSTTSQGVPFTVTAIRTANTTANGHGIAENVSHTLDGANGQAIALLSTSTGNTSHCLNAGGMGRQDYETETMVVNTWGGTKRKDRPDGGFYARVESTTKTLDAAGGLNPACSNGGTMIVNTGVRRLTPVECERLQGFPDDWTLVPHRGKPAADGPRYKAIGNSMAVPVMRWIGERIKCKSESQ